MRILSLNIGPARSLEVRGQSVQTGIFKRPTQGPQKVGPNGFEGDVLVERRKAGRDNHAVYAFPHEHYAYWQERLGCEAFELGHFGENLTIEGLLETEVRVGDVLRCGSARLQVTLPRIPCRKLNAKMGFSFGRVFLESRRVGFYLRVLEPGAIAAGDAVEVVESDPHSPTMDELIRVGEYDYWDTEALEKLLLARDLAPFWRERLEDKLQRARSADGWFGLRALEVVRREEESPEVVSLHLRCALGRELAPFRAGQYLTVAVRPHPVDLTARRSYAISSDPADLSTYRITVRLQHAPESHGVPDGVVSAHLHRSLKVGDHIRAAAPRGFFTLDDEHLSQELTFAAQGTGIAPIVSMLHQWARARPERPARLFYECDDGANVALLREVRAIAEAHPLRVQVSFRAPGPGDVEGRDFDARGPLDAERVIGDEEGRAARRFFLSGPNDFVVSLRDGLLALGIDAAHVREERFGRRLR